ncbi:hypothetical protein BIY23_04275 [Wolbachia pipientis]|uniref:Uncharacterized protein n=1 Tax=Wolbachia pipientis TaxID=955 RepID=A0A1E7QIW0_WOLPI|nr:hypothetical protein [Wolbachia pipientis]OEY86412.1 hypothetical protein BIY23_04275 [Wolbachia pipientis]
MKVSKKKEICYRGSGAMYKEPVVGGADWWSAYRQHTKLISEAANNSKQEQEIWLLNYKEAEPYTGPNTQVEDSSLTRINKEKQANNRRHG